MEIAPLEVPSSRQRSNMEAVAHYPAVDLFVQRAQAVRRDFELNESNVEVVAEICRRLDGLPLAIELAAARIRLFPPDALAKRLEHRLPLLTGGTRDAPSRQQSLRAAIDWSYGLLSDTERILLARLSVFSGGCTLEAAEGVCNVEGDLDCGVLDGIGCLVDNSLLQREDDGIGEPRFGMLETVQEFAAEQLSARGEAETYQRRQLEFLLTLAAGADVGPTSGSERIGWMERMELEAGNIRSALRLAEAAYPEHGLRLAAALGQFWYTRGHWTEGQEWLARMLAAGPSPVPARLGAIHWLATFAAELWQYDDADRLHREEIALARQFRDSVALAQGLFFWGVLAWMQGQYDDARLRFEESLAIAQKADDGRGTVRAITGLGGVARVLGEADRARLLFEQSLHLAHELGDAELIVHALAGAGRAAADRGDRRQAVVMYEDCLALAQRLGDRESIGAALMGMGHLAFQQGDYLRAEDLHSRALLIARETQDTKRQVTILRRFAQIATLQRRAPEAARLWGADAALRRSLRLPDRLGGAEQEEYVEMARRELDDAVWKQVWSEGCAMTLDDAVQYVLGLPGVSAAPAMALPPRTTSS
jgi:tetratricopeptide (TPR) repeat protein